MCKTSFITKEKGVIDSGRQTVVECANRKSNGDKHTSGDISKGGESLIEHIDCRHDKNGRYRTAKL